MKENDILKKLSEIDDRDTHTILHDFFIMAACAVRNGFEHSYDNKYEERYKSLASTYKPCHLSAMAQALAMMKSEYSRMLDGDAAYTDLMGELYMRSATSNNKAGQFFTPYSISVAMAQATFSDSDVLQRIAADPDDVITMMEPSCGSGGMVVAAVDVLSRMGVNYSWNVFADCMDIDERCVCMCYLQLSLLGVPAIIRRGDALTLKQYDEWHTPAYIINYLHFRHRVHGRQRNDHAAHNSMEPISSTCNTQTAATPSAPGGFFTI